MFDRYVAAQANTAGRTRRHVLIVASIAAHFAMGVGLEAGLTIDAMANDLAELLDIADDAALGGDIDALADALGGLGERLLFMRPFIPDKANALPANWKKPSIRHVTIKERCEKHA